MTAVERIEGAFIMELAITVMLYGITTTQAHFYWWSYPQDAKLIKRIVLIVWILETVHTVFCLHLMYNYTIVDFGSLEHVVNLVWSSLQRSFKVSDRNVVITVIPAILLFVRVEFHSSLGPRVSTHGVSIITITFGLVLSAVVDLVIAALLIYYLQSNQSLSQRTHHIISSLQAYVINTGALTMIVSIAIVLTFALINGSFLFLGLVEIQSKLYANSFLATLNARQHLNQASADPAREAISMSTSIYPRSQNFTGQTHSIEVYRTVERDSTFYGSELPSPGIAGTYIGSLEGGKTDLYKAPPLSEYGEAL
ncbi:hypothetical protein IEO21_06835 [Rhodonia placenta]|uniref:DUF6534 domain-containing protein n=1 Tax=Rhodonia placenta TaxID=104341 RepID=A0A8H7U0X3_9APHY|nr:hypothetical protein IEO21_06835 [Postia placenta]